MFKVVFWAFFEISLLVTLEPQVGHTKFPDFYPSFEIIIHSCGKVYCLGPQAEKETKHKMAYVCRLNYFSYSCGPSVGFRGVHHRQKTHRQSVFNHNNSSTAIIHVRVRVIKLIAPVQLPYSNTYHGLFRYWCDNRWVSVGKTLCTHIHAA